MKPMPMNRFFSCVLILGAVLLTACEGESKPFLESVEIETLGLTGIQVTPPANTQDDIFINPGQSMQMGISGSTIADVDVSLSTADRNWRSSNPAIFSVSDSGLVTGVGTVEGVAQVSVSIGGIQSAALDITVRNATLTSFDAIVGSATLERCLPDEYFAVGNFSDGSKRTLFSVDYDVADESTASLTDTDPATATINATSAGELTLTAQVGDVGPFPLQITVLNNLTGIAITPNPAAVDEDKTIGFAALGTYISDEEIEEEEEGGLVVPDAPGAPIDPAGTKTENISSNVNWEVTSGTANASVDNSGENKGQLLGLSAGTAVLTASCGTDRQATVNVIVNDVEDSESDELSFDVVGSRIVLAFGETRQLRVSRGSDFDSDEALSVADGVRYSVRSADLNFINEGNLETGLINPRVQGVEIVVTADLLDDDDEVVASGSITIEVQ